MRLHSSALLLLALLITATVHAQKQSFTVAGIKPYDKAVPGQVMDVLIEGLGSGTGPMVLPESDFNVEVSQDGITQTAKVRLIKLTMIPETNPETSNKDTIDFAGMRMHSYQVVSFVVPKGLHPGPAEVVASYKGRRGNAVSMEIIEKPLKPAVGTMAIMAVGGMPLERTQRPQGNDLGWRLERGTTARISVNPMVDPDDPSSAVLIRFRQGGNDYEAVTRIKSTPARVEKRSRGVGFFAAREELEVDVPQALELGKTEVEIRLKANGQLGDPTTITATITDMTRAAEAPNVSAPRLLAVTPSRVGAGQSILISIDRRGTLEPSPKDTQVIIEQENARYFATIEQNSALITAAGKGPDTPVGMFVRTTRQLTGRVQVRVLNPLSGEQGGLSEPVSLEIVDEVIPPQLISINESTDADLGQLKQIYETQKEAGREFSPYDPNSRYLTIRARGIDYNPRFVRITLQQADQEFALTSNDFSAYSNDGLIIRVPKALSGKFNFTIENFNGERYSTPVTKSFVLASRQ